MRLALRLLLALFLRCLFLRCFLLSHDQIPCVVVEGRLGIDLLTSNFRSTKLPKHQSDKRSYFKLTSDFPRAANFFLDFFSRVRSAR